MNQPTTIRVFKHVSRDPFSSSFAMWDFDGEVEKQWIGHVGNPDPTKYNVDYDGELYVLPEGYTIAKCNMGTWEIYDDKNIHAEIFPLKNGISIISSKIVHAYPKAL